MRPTFDEIDRANSFFPALYQLIDKISIYDASARGLPVAPTRTLAEMFLKTPTKTPFYLALHNAKEGRVRLSGETLARFFRALGTSGLNDAIDPSESDNLRRLHETYLVVTGYYLGQSNRHRGPSSMSNADATRFFHESLQTSNLTLKELLSDPTVFVSFADQYVDAPATADDHATGIRNAHAICRYFETNRDREPALISSDQKGIYPEFLSDIARLGAWASQRTGHRSNFQFFMKKVERAAATTSARHVQTALLVLRGHQARLELKLLKPGHKVEEHGKAIELLRATKATGFLAGARSRDQVASANTLRELVRQGGGMSAVDPITKLSGRELYVMSRAATVQDHYRPTSEALDAGTRSLAHLNDCDLDAAEQASNAMAAIVLRPDFSDQLTVGTFYHERGLLERSLGRPSKDYFAKAVDIFMVRGAEAQARGADLEMRKEGG